MTRWLLALLGLAAVLGVLYAERRGQPRYVETAPGKTWTYTYRQP